MRVNLIAIEDRVLNSKVNLAARTNFQEFQSWFLHCMGVGLLTIGHMFSNSSFGSIQSPAETVFSETFEQIRTRGAGKLSENEKVPIKSSWKGFAT